MTKEEAIYILRNTAWLGGNEQVQKVEEAIDTLGGLIEGQKLKDALAGMVPYAICDAYTQAYTDGLTDAYTLVCEFSSKPLPEPYKEKEE